jgi:hypothetical protein
MSNSFTQVFGGTTIYPSDVSYLPLALDANISLEWPLEATAGSNVVARIIDITPSGAYTITMPDATAVSVGQTVLFNNIGPSTVAVNKADGAGILSIAAGQQWQAYLIDNTTVGGTWRTLRYGASTAQAQAAALAGPGLVTDGALLAQNYEVIDLSATPYTLTNPDRAKVFVWTGGLGTLNLPPASSAGDGWFVQVRNAGQGDLIIDPSSSELINASSTLRLQPGDSAVVVGDGSQWYTIGFGQQAVFAFDYTSVAVTGGTYTLSGSELNRIAYKFTGTLTSNVTIVVPATVQQYWVNNATTGAFTLSLRASGSGSSTLVTQASTSILYCDGTTIVPATTAVTFAGILPVTQGGTGANNGPSALTNLGGTGIGTAVFTATTTAAARTAIAAASSGANSDITSLTGLTTPLSVGQGGTGTATAFTSGSVVFGGASGVYSQDNANFFWDDANNRLGVGTASPLARLHVVGGTGILVSGNGASGYNTAQFLNDSGIGLNIGVGGSTAAGWTQNLANVSVASSQPLAFGTNNLERMRITAAGDVGIGTNSPVSKLNVIGDQILAGAAGTATLGLQIKGPAISAIPSAQVQGYIATGDSSMGVAGDLLIAPRTDATANVRFITGTTPTERMRITAAGDIGVGTVSPNYKLEVRTDAVSGFNWVGSFNNTATGSFGAGFLARSSVGSAYFYMRGDGLAYVENATNNALGFATNATEKMRITAAGDVGVGITSPSTRIHAYNNTANIPVIVRTQQASTGNSFDYASFSVNATGASGGLVAWATGSLRAGQVWVQSDGTQPLVLGTNDTERMRITSVGDIGVGTASPQSKFHVSGGYITAGNVSSTAGSKIIGGDYSGAEHITTFGSEFSSGGPVVGYGVWPSTSAALAFVSSASVALQRAAYTQTGNNHVWFTGASQTVAVGSAVTMTERMRMDGSGNLGLGTAPSGVRLDVNGNIRTTVGSGGTLSLFETDATRANQLFSGADASGSFINATFSTGGTAVLRLQTANNERMRITATGDVGIGVTNPAALLHVAGITRISDATNSTAIAIDPVTTGGLTSIIAQFGGSELALGSATVERVRIKAGGQVRFVPLAAAPASPQAGDVYYDSTTNKLRCYNGTIWNDLF